MGDVDGDSRVDVAFVIDGAVVYCRAPGAWEVVDHTLISATAVAFLPSITAGSPGAFVVVGGNGLQRLEWNASTQEFDVSTIANSNRWVNALYLTTYAHGSSCAVGGVSPVDGRTVTIIVDGGADAGTWSFTMPTQVDDLLLLNYDTDSSVEAATITQAGLRVRDLDATQIGSFNHSYAGGGHLARARSSGEVADHVAWLRTKNIGGDQEIAFAPGASPLATIDVASELAPAVGLLAVQAIAIDELLSEDFDTDLLVLGGSGAAPAIYYNRSSESSFGAVFDSGDYAPWTSQPSFTTFAAPLVADFDLNGLEDLMFADEVTVESVTSGVIQLALSVPPPIVWEDESPCANCIGADVFNSIALYQDGSAGSKLRLELKPASMAVDWETSGYNYLQIIAWYETGDLTSGFSVVPIANNVYPLPTSLPGSSTRYAPEIGLTGTGAANSNGFTCEVTNQSDVIWIETRVLTSPGSNPDFATHTGPTWVVFLGADCENLHDRRTGQTGFLNIFDIVEDEVTSTATAELCSGTVEPRCFESLEAAGAAMERTPDMRMSGGTRRRLAPGGTPLATPVSPGSASVQPQIVPQ